MKLNYIFYIVQLTIAFAYLANGSYYASFAKNYGVNHVYISKNLPYLYFHLQRNARCLSFSVRTRGEFHVTLTQSRWHDENSIDFRLGTRGDHQSNVIKTDSCNRITSTHYNTPHILHNNQCFNSFWLTWKNGVIKLGRHGERRELLKWCDRNARCENFDNINFFGIRSIIDEAEFFFEEPNCPYY